MCDSQAYRINELEHENNDLKSTASRMELELKQANRELIELKNLLFTYKV